MSLDLTRNMMIRWLAPTVISALFLLACVTAGAAFQLVSEQEAAYPDDPYQRSRGAPTAAPQIEVVSPALSGLVRSPFRLKIRFKAHGGAAVDRDSITITYKKIPAVDITQRINGFVVGDDIDIAEAELPAGTHPFEINVRDSRGRLAAPLFFRVSIAK